MNPIPIPRIMEAALSMSGRLYLSAIRSSKGIAVPGYRLENCTVIFVAHASTSTAAMHRNK